MSAARRRYPTPATIGAPSRITASVSGARTLSTRCGVLSRFARGRRGTTLAGRGGVSARRAVESTPRVVESARRAESARRCVRAISSESNRLPAVTSRIGTADESAARSVNAAVPSVCVVSTGRSNVTRSVTESRTTTALMRGPTVSCTNASSSSELLSASVTAVVSHASRGSSARLLLASTTARTT